MEQRELIIKPVAKPKFSGISGYSGTGTSIAGAQLGRNGAYKTGLNKKEEEAYTKKLGLNPGTLNASNAEFWGSILNLRLPNDKPYFFNINSDIDEIKYRVLVSRSDVAANKIELKDKPNALFYIEDFEAEAKVEEAALDHLYEATKQFMDLTSEERRGYLRLYNFKGVENVSDTVIKTRLFKEINNDPKRFLNLTIDPDISIRIDIENMIEKGLLKKRSNHYYFQDEVIGNSVEKCIEFFNDPKNQSIKLATLEELRLIDKKK